MIRRAFDPRGAASHLGSLPAGGKFQRLADGAVRRGIGE